MRVSLMLHVHLRKDLPQMHTQHKCWIPHITRITWNNPVLTGPYVKPEPTGERANISVLHIKATVQGVSSLLSVQTVALPALAGC